MKKTILALMATSVLVGCASTPSQESLAEKIQQLELNQRYMASRLQMTNAVMPKEIEYLDGIKVGNPNAPYVIVEFTDLECPYCSTFQQETYPEFKKKYVESGEVLFVAREFPLKSIHKNATEAAVALRCVYQQKPEVYSEVKSQFFANRENYGQDFYLSVAKEQTLNLEQFSECLNSPEQLNIVNDSYKYAVGVGLNSTPSFIFGKNSGSAATDYRIGKGALSLENIEKGLESVK